jgi:hypothetical protein
LLPDISFAAPPFIKKHQDILVPIHQLYVISNLNYAAYKMAYDSVVELYSARTCGMKQPTAYSNTLSSRIQLNPVNSTTMKAWVKELQQQGNYPF